MGKPWSIQSENYVNKGNFHIENAFDKIPKVIKFE